MDDVIFLTLDDVLAIHQLNVAELGGDPAILNQALLESALAQPPATFDGKRLHLTLAEMAAAYMYHILRNHPFVDGNKRTAAHSAAVFLQINGHPVTFDPDELEEMANRIATGKVSKQGLAGYFRRIANL